jgi:hypothetical protein
MRSKINVMGFVLVVHVLDNGERVVEAEGVERMFEAPGGPKALTPEEANAIMRAIHPEWRGR